MSKTKKIKGSLVKEISKPLPGKLLDNNWLKKEVEQLLKKHSGIYGLYKGKKLYYIGLAKDLHRRIVNHTKDRHAGKWNNFRLIIIKKVGYIKDLEALALSLYKPLGNKNIPRVPSSYHINGMIKKVIEKNEKYLDELKEEHQEDLRINRSITSEIIALKKVIRR